MTALGFARKVREDENMSNAAKKIELPEDLQAFAEERVRAGQSASVEDVVKEALEAGIAELDAGRGVRQSPKELMAEIHAELGMKRDG